MEMDNIYQYSKILDQRTIRLMLLEPSPDLEAEIRCSLIQAPLEALENDLIEHYLALSYVWGDPTPACSVFIGEKRLNITTSLHCALQHLRDPLRTLRLWADGICIDQKDVEDRNQQVQLMKSVYTLAKHTVIFLGPSDDDANSVIRYLQSWPDYPSTPSSPSLLEIAKTKILSHTWFTRVWVLQELVFSVDPWIQYGTARVRWDRFCKFAMPESYGATKSNTMSGAFAMNCIRSTSKRNDVLLLHSTDLPVDPSNSELLDHLFEILLTRRGVGVSDPRDMLYGHLGLLKQSIKPGLEIDYGKSVAQVYEDIAHLHIRITGSLHILLHVEKIELDQRRSGLPSWVPDWTVPAKSLRKTRFFINANYQFAASLPHHLIVKTAEYGRIMYLVDYPPAGLSTESQRRRSVYGSQQSDKRLVWGIWHDEKVERSKDSPFSRPARGLFRERFTSCDLTQVPASIYDAHKMLCAKLYDEIDKRDYGYFRFIKTELDLTKLIADHHNFSHLNDMPSSYSERVSKFVRLLTTMEVMVSGQYVPHCRFAVLDTGGFVCVPKRARVNDYICGQSDSVMVFRPSCTTESEEIAQRLWNDPTVRTLCSGTDNMSQNLQVGKYIAGNHFTNFVDDLAFRALQPLRDPVPIVLAIH